jgi:hypothetical protein
MVQGRTNMREGSEGQVLRALIQGIDPSTGEQLPAGTVLQRTEVLRALLAGVAALEESAARARRRERRPRNAGRPWTEAEEAALAAAFREGASPQELASRHDRSLTAIESRLERLGLLDPAERRTRSRFVETADTGSRAARRPH